jgi:class 3 adenylate cyclase
VIETEPRPPVRAIVASFLFTDLVDFSKGAASEQYVAKAAFAACLRSNLTALREADYWIKDTGDGALIAFITNPEHALYMALAIAQDYAQAADESEGPSHSLRTGLHLGTVKETVDVEARRNYIGDGINATKRIMDFAAPGQIAASRNFFEAVANLDTEYAALFQHVGALDDKHGRAHELYVVTPNAEVLKKLKLDFGAAAPRRVTSGDQGAPAVSVKKDVAAPTSPQVRVPSSRAAEATRTRLSPLVWLVGLVVLAAAIFWMMKGLWQTSQKVEPVTSPAVDVPKPASGLEAPRSVAAEPVTPTPAAPSLKPKLEQVAPVPTTHTPDVVTVGATPQVVAPASAPTGTVDRTSRISASSSPTPPVQAPVASDRGSTRCSHIVEKAAIGEPLSEEEKKELANSCR